MNVRLNMLDPQSIYPQDVDWKWPRAALVVVLLSLLLWGVLAGAACLVFS